MDYSLTEQEVRQKSSFKRRLGPVWVEGISWCLTRKKQSLLPLVQIPWKPEEGLRPVPLAIPQSHRCVFNWIYSFIVSLDKPRKQHEGLHVRNLRLLGLTLLKSTSKDGPHMHGTSRAVWILGLNKAHPWHTLGMTGIKSTFISTLPLSHTEHTCSTFT